MWILPPSNLTYAQPAMGDGHYLLSFFMTEVVSSLAPIVSDGYKLWKLLFQLSFSDDSPASMAVLRAILALASLYRHGHGEESLQLKVAALNSLAASMNGLTTGTREIYQHVAVGMLLCAFEIFLPSESSFQWPLYLSGAKSMLHKICDGGHPKLIEFDLLVLWVHYHDVLGKFASRHWKVQSAENASIFKVPGMASTLASVANDQVISIFGCSLEMINLIARMSEVQFDSEMSYKHRDADQGSLDSIEHDLMVLKQDTMYFSGTNISEEVNRGSKMSKLYQLAGLIYFERVLKRNPDSIRVARWSGEAFDLLREFVICERPFPLFFIACEAHTDTQRELILSILERTHNRSNQRRLYAIQAMIESMWVQHDLISDSNTEGRVYVDTLNAIMSSNELLPTLA
ncbi:fungal-specific transcription factor domain-containing protein [Penicillium canescens]|nr:fungal-specific transcription factor domain-containing protein [Penicillium canescens]